MIGVLLIHLSAIAQPGHKHIKKTKKQISSLVSDLTYNIISSEGKTFGYDILENNHKMVHQPSIPGWPGNKGFAKKTDAEKVAKLVIYKINHKQMPPTVSKHELDSLKIKLQP